MSGDWQENQPGLDGREPSTSPSGVPGGWARFVGFFIDNKLIVVVLTGLLVAAGLYTAPFDWKLGGMPRDRVPVDAIPNIGKNQQIVFTEWPGRSPRDIEDQITYPLTTALLGIPGVETIRSSSMFGFSSIYVIFEEGVDFYWSRSRVLEKLASLPKDTLPEGVQPQLGPDATALGQIFWYKLEGRDPQGDVVGGWSLQELRSLQDWHIRYALQSVKGVSEVASVGGYVREYQVDVDPDAMRAHDVTLDEVADAVRQSNLDVGARTLEINRVEYIVRGLGFVERVEDLEKAVVDARAGHTPIRVSDVARVGLGPAQRRGALDDAGAETVGGVVVVRHGANPMEVIQRVKAKIAEIEPGLPARELEDGTTSQVRIVPFYDRTGLIQETLSTLNTALSHEILVTVIVILVMLRNFRSSVVVSAVLPLAVLGTFVAMKYTGVVANIMALAGIAIAIGTMVDMGILFVENIISHLDRAPRERARQHVIRDAGAEIAPAVLTSVGTTILSFLPVFGLTGQEGKLFTPLALTKTYAMAVAFVLAVVALPALAHVVMRRQAEPAEDVQPGMRRVLTSVTRRQHLRDWVGVAGSLVLMSWSVAAGLFLLMLAIFRLAEPLLPPRFRGLPTWVEVAVAVVAVTFVLSEDWMPLGYEVGAIANFLFVSVLLVVVLGGLLGFRYVYPALLGWGLRHKMAALILPSLVVLGGVTAWLGFDRVFGWLPTWLRTTAPVEATASAFPGFGREDMPPFDEGSFLYMPTTMPHASIGQSLDMMQQMDAAIAQIPEVTQVVGKLGRADTPLDPAPISMYETIINYKPEYRVNEEGEQVRQWRDHIRSREDIWEEITRAADVPGLTGAPMLQPIKTRVVMLQSGMRAPMGVRVRAPDLETLQEFSLRVEDVLRGVSSIDPTTVNADRIVGKPYLEIDIDREAIARYGLTVKKVQHTIQVALGGVELTRTVEERERYPVRVRYMREERDSINALRRVLVSTPGGQQIPLEELATVRYKRGPKVIKTEDTFLVSYVTFGVRRDEGGDAVASEAAVVEQARRELKRKAERGGLDVPSGVSWSFAGTYENIVRAEKRLSILVPLTLALIFLLLYLQFRRTVTTLVIYSGVAIAVASGLLLLWLYGQAWFLHFDVAGRSMQDLFRVGTIHMSVAVWVGIIALIGVATDNGVVLATYLAQRFREQPPRTREDVRRNALEAGRRRVRPCLMTTATLVIALIPVVTSQGKGADVMVPMALPSIGGMAGQLLTLLVVPVLYAAVEERRIGKYREQDAM